MCLFVFLWWVLLSNKKYASCRNQIKIYQNCQAAFGRSEHLWVKINYTILCSTLQQSIVNDTPQAGQYPGYLIRTDPST